MKLEESIELLHRSSERMMQCLAPDSIRDEAWWIFMRREL